jgi:dTDP-4-amino-4,6-dideoxygalactose transaminase
MNKMAMFDTEQQMPGAEKFCENVLSLPIHPYLKKSEVIYICKCIGEYYGI